ncbi:MAG: NADH-quinone oxidoreductase subunit L [Opitutae bacterium]|nr:NADH-quinone oxidoreductase subunit L [Opitutae bacterium]
MEGLISTILLIPLVSAVIILFFLRRHGELAAKVSTGAAGLVMLISVSVILADSESAMGKVSWLSLGDLQLSFGFLLDAEARLLLFVVSFVGFWIHVFSLGYMREDPAKSRFFGGLSIFMFSMLGIVVADNLAMLFIFWELVGFSSYMLIAHYFHAEESAAASKKALVVNRLGDIGFLMGIALTQARFGTLEFTELAKVVPLHPELVTAGLGFLLICGFLAKSAQFPLHVWLPDAMAGPTPISALIHAATMVAAGIYLLVRIDFLLVPEVTTLIALLGAAMALYAGFCALVQSDIKKVLAYSTLSQLGYMAATVGVGMPGLAMFHLTTHAFFKALLFLGAGSVIMAMHHEQDIFKMGGLRKRMPWTSGTFLLGVLAISGVTLTSGFFSKDAMLLAAYEDSIPVFSMLLAGALLTAFYMGRLYWLVFHGSSRSKSAKSAVESESVVTIPLVVLAVFAIFGGFSFVWPNELSQVFSAELAFVHDSSGHLFVMTFGSLAWIFGLWGSWNFYSETKDSDPLAERANVFFRLCHSRLFFDEFYDFCFRRPLKTIAKVFEALELLFISGLMVRGVAGITALFGLATGFAHRGGIRSYALWFLGGLVALLAYAGGCLEW